ncbi:YwiC-like family protein [Bacillus sp. OTU530]|jgi:hypothetical protein|uniref:YwiC-like family protein n=1 Tax=Bacillus sp. OTU530 TaxID=3043862 RepID=UPI00313BC88B
MKPIIPTQHGAWAMLFIPFIIGIAAGSPTLYHLPLLLAWLFVYLGTYPLLMYIKQRRKKHLLQWALTYFVAALIFGSISLMHEWRIVYAAVIMLPLFLVNVCFAITKNERALLNDIAAIITFSSGGMMSYYFGTGILNQTAWWIFTLCFCYFVGSTFYVKTMLREKHNPIYRIVSWGYHALLIIGMIMLSPALAIAFVPSLVRAILFYGKNMPVLKVGTLEIANSVYFFFVILLMVNKL